MKNIVFKRITLSLILCSAPVGFAMDTDLPLIPDINMFQVHQELKLPFALGPRPADEAGLAPVAPPAKKVKKPNVCGTCNDGKDWGYTLKRHQRTHSGARPYKCEICGHTATQAGHLITHMRTHTGEKPFACQITGCSSAFGDPSALANHLKTKKHAKHAAMLLMALNRTSPSHGNDDE